MNNPREVTLGDKKKVKIADISSILQDRLDLTLTDIGKKEDLQVLASVMTGILTIPRSSAPCERIF
jgi:hypothetical protein